MHETGVVRDLVHRLEQTARDAGATRIKCAHVWLGALSQFSAEHFRDHFVDETRGTLAEGAQLDIEVSTDAFHPASQHLLITSVDLEVEE